MKRAILALLGHSKTELQKVSLEAELEAIDIAATQSMAFSIGIESDSYPLGVAFEEMSDSLFGLRDAMIAFWRRTPETRIDPMFSAGGFYALADLPGNASNRQKVARFFEWSHRFRQQAERLTEVDEIGIADKLMGVADSYTKIGALLADQLKIEKTHPLLDFVREIWSSSPAAATGRSLTTA